MIRVYTASYELPAGEKKRKVEHELGLSLLQQGLKELYDLLLNIEELQAEIKTGEHGKPSFKNHRDIHFNISHTDGLVVCAFSDEPVGIDVETIHEFKDSLPRRVLTKTEQEFLFGYKDQMEKYRELFFRFWTLKESYLKWEGSGFQKEPQSISFDLNPEETSIRCLSSDKDMYFCQEIMDEKYVLAICSGKESEYSLINTNK